MREIDRIASLLRAVHSGDPWHGPSRAAALDGITAEEASRRPIPNGHTIWEIVLHMTGWTGEVCQRLCGGEPRQPEGGDWPEAPGAAEAAWQEALADLEEAHLELLEVLLDLDDGALEWRVGSSRDRALGSGVANYEMLHGLVNHDAYHTGQIALLKKAIRGAGPSPPGGAWHIDALT